MCSSSFFLSQGSLAFRFKSHFKPSLLLCKSIAGLAAEKGLLAHQTPKRKAALAPMAVKKKRPMAAEENSSSGIRGNVVKERSGVSCRGRKKKVVICFSPVRALFGLVAVAGTWPDPSGERNGDKEEKRKRVEGPSKGCFT